VTSDPVLLSAEDLRSLNLADNYIDGAMDPTDELLLAREVIRALVAGSYSDERDAARAERRDYLVLRALGPSLWGYASGGLVVPLGDAKPNLTRYLAALEALPQEDSR